MAGSTDFLKKVFDAGVVGCGGAGFPTHVKLDCQAEWLIVNGAECEPLLRSDRYLMRHCADSIVQGAEEAAEQIGARQCVIALKSSYVQEQEALKEAIRARKSTVSLHLLDPSYPSGDEQSIVFDVTGRIVPPAGIPKDVGCVVSNVGTMAAVRDAACGVPFTERYLTVAGYVKRPCVLRVPVGASISKCIEQAGGVKTERYGVILGGPMMGSVLVGEAISDAAVTKTTSGILVLPEDHSLIARRQVSIKHMLNRARSVCIQCSYCTQLCPRHLLGHPIEPHRIMRRLATCTSLEDALQDPSVLRAQLCSECGVCETYACPMQLQPRRINAALKQLLAAEGQRYVREDGDDALLQAREERENRKIPTGRMAARAGVSRLEPVDMEQALEVRTDLVSIPLKQHAGQPSRSVVKKGDLVEKGQLIAACSKRGLGAQIHASIDGRILSVGESIVIQRGGGEANV